MWIFGELWCRGWLVTDVWISTASILNLCAISVDRYVAVTRPVKYRSIMRARRAKTIVAGVWIVSFLICFPPLLSQWNPSTSLSSPIEDLLPPSARLATARPEKGASTELSDYIRQPSDAGNVGQLLRPFEVTNGRLASSLATSGEIGRLRRRSVASDFALSLVDDFSTARRRLEASQTKVTSAATTTGKSKVKQSQTSCLNAPD